SVRSARAQWQLHGASRPGLYRLLTVTVGVLALIGLVMVFSASSVASLSVYGSAWVVFARQLAWMALAIAAFSVASRLDYHRWQRWSVPLLCISIVLLILVLIPGIGIYVSGSRRWIGYGALRFQPSEIAKIALLMFLADLVTRRADEVHRWRRVLFPALGMLAVVGLLVMKEPDMDSTIVLALIVGAVLLVGGIRMRDLLGLGGIGLGLAAILAVSADYRRARVFSFLHPFAQATGDGYQLAQSLIALGSGGLTGLGLGASRQKWLFLPNAHTDFIFAIIGEELGILGAFAVLVLFAALAVWGTMIAMRAPDRFGMLVAAGITTWIVGQALINIGAVIGVLPVSGIPLPFVSFGGSSLLFTMLAAGILANVARQGGRERVVALEPEPTGSPRRLRSVNHPVFAGARGAKR
ncbi:MAG: putative lipid II flippase FtsW, partial [Acidimicrobiia bacterium]